jgi:hypothetical protein
VRLFCFRQKIPSISGRPLEKPASVQKNGLISGRHIIFISFLSYPMYDPHPIFPFGIIFSYQAREMDG